MKQLFEGGKFETTDDATKSKTIIIRASHMSDEAKERIHKSLYDLSEFYDFDTYLQFDLLTSKLDDFLIDVRRLSEKNKHLFHSKIEALTKYV